ncbi:prolipoprotein diacylglyceryl transferase [Desertibaculum subflavum]|uniref:prolipoprotein diacylglyceryl transferase n=1 Tax=Desertibaculum subflavum TaxID=2268458 RepID=UPI000E66928F
MLIHTLFDALAWAMAALAALWVRRRHGAAFARIGLTERPGYWISGLAGLGLGASAVAALNNGLAGLLPIGHSVAGALAGGILAVEAYKAAQGIRGSTGGILVLPLALGIAVGRFGCLAAGIEDFTYGLPTALPWAHDFGDGVPRHPVPVYESLAMLGFAALFVAALERRWPIPSDTWFYLFAIWYGAQRFAWEFLKPYPLVLGPLNLYHLICAGLIVYGLGMLAARGRQQSGIAAGA